MNNFIKPSQGATASLRSNFTQPPLKIETVLIAFIHHGKAGMNKLEAIQHYGDTCLNISVSILTHKLGLKLKREQEKIKNRADTISHFTRYSFLTNHDESNAKSLVNRLRVKLGLSPIKWEVSA